MHNNGWLSDQDKISPFPTYKTWLEHRREQAFRSVLVRVNKNEKETCALLQSVGPIRAAFKLTGEKACFTLSCCHYGVSMALLLWCRHGLVIMVLSLWCKHGFVIMM